MDIIHIFSLSLIALHSLIFTQSSADTSKQTLINPITPAPSECTTTPRSSDEVNLLISNYEHSTLSNYSSYPESHAAEFATTSAIYDTMRMAIACQNSGDILRLLSMESDRLVSTTILSDLDLKSPPTPLPLALQNTLIGITYTLQFDDGRVGAVVLIDDPSDPSPVESQFVIFAQQGGKMGHR